MQPKKKSMVDPIIYGVCLVLVLYLALHGAIVYETVINMVTAGEIEKNQQLMTFLNLFSDRLSLHPLSIGYNQYTQNWLIYGGLGWLIVVLAIEGGKKNYIHGKEFGTARWGTQADIRDLFASTLEAQDIKRAKQVTNPIGRWKVRSKIYKQCEENGKQLQKLKLEELKEKDEIRKLDGSFDKRLTEKDKEKIKEEVKTEVETSKKQAWLPDRLKDNYEKRLEEIENAGSLYSKEEKEKQKQAAKDEYERAIKEFRNPAIQTQKIKRKYKDADMLFTKTERISFYNYILNQNTLILGGSGSGKTRGYVMPNVLQAHSSYVITDPKGEILEKAGKFLKEVKNYKIRVLNLDEKDMSDGYNPFAYIHPDRPGYEERVLMLIETIIVNTDGGERKGGPDPFWDKAERLFLQSVFFFTAVAFVPEERNMNTVMELIRMLQIKEDDDNMDSDLDYFVRIFAKEYGEDHIGVQQYREFREKSSGKTAKSIVITAVARLAPFRTSAIRKLFSYDSMCLDRVGEEKTAIFVVVPPTDSTFNFIAGMLFTQLFQELQYCATQVHKHDGQRLPVPCRFILDEFANTCTIPNFVKILAYARSFGIGITPILQSLEQIKNAYKDEWGVIVDNCNTLLYLGSITHQDTLDYMSKLLGKGTFDKRTTGRTKGKSGSSSQNFDVVGRELMLPDEIRKMPKKDCLFIVGGRNPFYSEKYAYESHPNYRFTSDADEKYSYEHEPQKPPEKGKPQKEEKEKTPHGEDGNGKANENDKAKEVKSNLVKVETDPKKELSDMTKNMDNLDYIDDDDLNPDEGETPDYEAYMQMVMEKEETEKKETKQTLLQETQAHAEEVRANRIRVETNLLRMVNHLGRCIRSGGLESLKPMPDEDTYTDYGENDAEEVEKTEELLMDEDTPDEAAVNDVKDELNNMLDALENELSDFNESDLEISEFQVDTMGADNTE